MGSLAVAWFATTGTYRSTPAFASHSSTILSITTKKGAAAAGSNTTQSTTTHELRQSTRIRMKESRLRCSVVEATLCISSRVNTIVIGLRTPDRSQNSKPSLVADCAGPSGTWSMHTTSCPGILIAAGDTLCKNSARLLLCILVAHHQKKSRPSLPAPIGGAR